MVQWVEHLRASLLVSCDFKLHERFPFVFFNTVLYTIFLSIIGLRA